MPISKDENAPLYEERGISGLFLSISPGVLSIAPGAVSAGRFFPAMCITNLDHRGKNGIPGLW